MDAETRWARRARVALLCGIAATLLPLPVEAQGGRLGVIGGVNFATLRGLDDVDLDKRTGSMGGISLVLPLGSTFALQTEALVVTGGAQPSSGTGDGISLTYAQVPVLLRLSLGAGGSVAPHVYAGPYFGLRIRCQIDTGSGDSDCDDVGGVNTETVDVGGIVGGGLDFDLGGLVLTGGARYGFGVSKVAEFDTGSVRESAKNGSFSIYAGLAIRFGGR